ncbi:hypothetical protein ACFRAE_00775 [Sphingobacterium sp. HJSM2_6]|uniref:hypothetical protein n=1 Tax=Sphingobacterium sp. HJSM2_6 TaxID=3366264 RepID=UPI003BCB782A
MKISSFFKIALALGVITFSSSCEKEKKVKPIPTKPKSIKVSYKLSATDKDAKLTALTITKSKGGDSTLIAANLVLPKNADVIMEEQKKGNIVGLKATFDKIGKYSIEIQVDGKKVQGKDLDIKDVKDLTQELKHTF